MPNLLGCFHLVVAASLVKQEKKISEVISVNVGKIVKSSAHLTGNANCLSNIYFQCSACSAFEHHLCDGFSDTSVGMSGMSGNKHLL